MRERQRERTLRRYWRGCQRWTQFWNIPKQTLQRKEMFALEHCFLGTLSANKKKSKVITVTEHTPSWRERGWEWMKRCYWKPQFAAPLRTGAVLWYSFLQQHFVGSPVKGTLLALLNAKWMKEKQETSLNAANSFNSLWIYPYSNQSSNNGIMILIT